jgi:hypothetical protein
MSTVTCGEAWLNMRDMPINRLVPIASRPGFHLEEEMARTLLRNKLVTRRIRRTQKEFGPHHSLHNFEDCGCRPCRDLRKTKR